MLLGFIVAVSTLVLGFTIFSVISDQNKKMESQDEKSTIENMEKLPVEARTRPMVTYNVKCKDEARNRENEKQR